MGNIFRYLQYFPYKKHLKMYSKCRNVSSPNISFYHGTIPLAKKEERRRDKSEIGNDILLSNMGEYQAKMAIEIRYFIVTMQADPGLLVPHHISWLYY